MPILVDDDLLFEDEGRARPSVAVNTWLRQLPFNGCPAPRSWRYYAQVVRVWMEFLAEHGVGLFGTRGELRAALSSYAVVRSHGPLQMRYAASTWNQHMSILSVFYRWAVEEGHAGAVPFTFKQAESVYGDVVRAYEVNLARRRMPKAHVTVKHLEPDFARLFVMALGGLRPDGTQDDGYRGRELARNSAVGRMVLATGLRRQEFSYLLAAEVPALPPGPTAMPIAFPVPAGITKGGKFRTTWISYEALAEVHRYIGMGRAVSVDGSSWRPAPGWGEPLVVSEADGHGGRLGGRKVAWAGMRPAERRRLVAPGGGSMLLGVRSDGGPFTAWATVFARTSARIRERFEPRFPTVHPHRLRHSFALATLEYLVGGYYAQAAQMAGGADPDAALALYLLKNEPLLVLRDLLGHSSVLATETYLRRLDMTRVYRDASERAGLELAAGRDAAWREADAEFDAVAGGGL